MTEIQMNKIKLVRKIVYKQIIITQTETNNKYCLVNNKNNK